MAAVTISWSCLLHSSKAVLLRLCTAQGYRVRTRRWGPCWRSTSQQTSRGGILYSSSGCLRLQQQRPQAALMLVQQTAHLVKATRAQTAAAASSPRWCGASCGAKACRPLLSKPLQSRSPAGPPPQLHPPPQQPPAAAAGSCHACGGETLRSSCCGTAWPAWLTPRTVSGWASARRGGGLTNGECACIAVGRSSVGVKLVCQLHVFACAIARRAMERARRRGVGVHADAADGKGAAAVAADAWIGRLWAKLRSGG
jgi:hypothetical protein